MFARIPGSGTWGSALLLDGNIGIGGAPDALLVRLRQLLCAGGEVLVELAPAGPVQQTVIRATAGFPWRASGAPDLIA